VLTHAPPFERALFPVNGEAAKILEIQPVSTKDTRPRNHTVDHYDIRDLPFHITRLGRGPDYGFRRERMEDWLTIVDTRYTLTPPPNGGTALQRRIVWRRHLAPDIYFGWLEQTVMERGQVRLLELVRSRVADLREKAREGQN
jgi:hypothetical protein